MVVVIGCKWHLASGLEAANEVSGLRVQVATFMVSRSSTWRVGLVAGAERVYPKAAFISGGGPPRRPAAGGGEVRSLKTGGQRLQVVGHSSWLQLVEVLFAAVVVVHSDRSSRSASRSEVNSEQVVAALAVVCLAAAK